MSHLNVEIKARCSHTDQIRLVLKQHKAVFRGVDRQVDTYFKLPHGRLKLREGNIENYLIHYDRPDTPGPKRSIVTLYKPPSDPALREILSRSLEIHAVVRKTREIYHLENVKFHIDQVDGLGQFIEIEAIDDSGTLAEVALRAQCEKYVTLFRIPPDELVECSYSDMIAPVFSSSGNSVAGARR